MQEFLYGKLNSETIIKQYTSVESPTLKLYIDNKKNLLSGEVLRTQGTLSIKMSGSILGTFNGSQNVNIEIPPLVLDKSDTETADIDLSQDGTHLQVNVKKVPNKLIINKADGSKQEYDGGAEVEISLNDDILARVDELDSQINDIASIVDSKAPSSDVDVIADNVAVNTVDIEGIKDNTALIQHETGSFFAGNVEEDVLSATGANRIVIGNSAYAISQGDIAIGYNASNSKGNTYSDSSVMIGNNAQGSTGDSIAIGHNSRSRGSVVIGNDAGLLNFGQNVAIGHRTKLNGSSNVAIGQNAECLADSAIAIGRGNGIPAKAIADRAIQFGEGTNSHTKTLQIWEHQLLDGNTGKIPDERLSDNILKANAQTLTTEQQAQVKENLGVTSFSIQDIPRFTNKLYINMANVATLAGMCAFTIIESSNFVVDWGDGTITNYIEATTEISHTYTDASFVGWIYIYGDWKGIVYDASSGTARQAIEKIIFDNNITTIANKAFRDARNLNYVYLPDSITLIDKQGFYGCSKLKQLKLPANVNIGQYGLASLGVTEIVFPQNADTDDLVFSHTPLKIFHIEEGRTKFPSDIHIFRGCFDLKELTLPSTLTSFDGGVMSTSNECLITKLTVKGSNTAMSRQFLTPHKVAIILVPYANLRTYKTKTNWTTYADFIYPESGNYSETITIPSTAWDSVTNTATVEAVGATSEARNIIEWFTSRDNVQVENIYGLNCTEQGTMSLTFTCETIPSEDIQVSVRYTLTNY